MIKIENLGKKYIIRHQENNRSKYVALRDIIAESARSIFKKILHPFEKHANNKSLYEEFWAVKDISFNVDQGDRIGIIGRNGAGKSTLLKLISRITEPTQGKISIKGRVASLLEVGTGFHPELTGRENIYLNGAILGMSKVEIKNKFDEIVEFSEIEKFLDTPVKRYSSGMYVRLAFSVAAHLEPEILLVDEVLSVGDTQFQKKCLGKMKDVGNEGRTVLFVSHNMSAIKSLCEKGICLLNGNVKYIGPVEETIKTYLSSATPEQQPYIELNNQPDLPVQILTVSVVDENNDLTVQHPYDKPFYIKIKLIIRINVSRIYIAFHIHNNEGETLIFSRDFEYDESLLLHREAGTYNYLIKIPAPLLMPGCYTLSLHIAEFGTGKIFSGINYSCPFEIIDNGSIRGKMGFPWIGKVYLPLTWECIKS